MKIRKNSRWGIVLLLVLAGGCSGGADLTAQKAGGSNGRLGAAEKSFNPSAFNPPVSTVLARDAAPLPDLSTSTMLVAAAPETVPGFRVQVMLSPSIDSATAVFDALNQALGDDWIYLVYDSPYYKVRVGNYTERPAAVPILNLLIGRGYRDAWIVPDNVLKPPPPRLTPDLLREERPVDRHW